MSPSLFRPTLIAVGVALCVCSNAVRADVVTDWNNTAINATLTISGFVQTRTLAHMHAAIFDAVNAIDRKYQPFALDLKAPSGASIDAAAATAAHGVLAAHVPAQKTALDAALTAALAKVADGQGKTDGVAAGRQAAEKMLTVGSNDGFTKSAPFVIPPPGLGVWQQTPQFGPMIQSHWRQVQPMAIKNVRDFDMGGPPALSSEAFARDYNEVKSMGARNSTTRSADQTAAAVFWTVQTMLPWNAAARAASTARKLSVPENARLFALLNIAAHDTQIVAIEQKARYNFWRPYNAIRYSGGAGNPALASDPNWEPLLNTPGFQEYPSGNCITSGGAEGVLRAFFGDDKVDVSVTHTPFVGIVRSWTSFSQMAKEVEDARVWGGIHYRTADEHGTQAGRKIAQFTIQNVLRPL